MIIETPLGAITDDPVRVPPRDFATTPAELSDGADDDGRAAPALAGCAGKPALALAFGVRRLLATPPDEAMALAYADLAVTGRAAYDGFAALEKKGVTEATVLALFGSQPSALAKASLARLLDRARRVKAWLDSKPGAPRAAAWNALFGPLAPPVRPWLGVSGEDDLPYQPVNLARTDRIESWTRIPLKHPYAKGGKLTTEVRWARSPNARTAEHVILLLHGLGSRIEETDALSRALAAHDIGTVSLDLPNHGHSERIPFDRLAVDMSHTGMKATGPFFALELMEAFVEAFVASVCASDAALATRLRSVGGGSLGGSLSLRLGIGKPGRTWPERSVAWSPGNAWMSFWDEPGNGGDPTTDEHRAAVDPFVAPGTIPIERARQSEVASSRHDYIRSVFEDKIPPGIHPQWHMWWRDGDFAAAREVFRDDARALRQEVYDEWHRRWCCALAHEQLGASMRGPMDAAPLGDWPIDHVSVPLLLMAGDHDDYPFAHIFTATKTLATRAQKLGAPKGSARFFENTGHSIHDERPVRLAANIAAFLRTPVGTLR
jgi:alpha-beta hydrolase superfamily lysophospholipase